VAPASAPSPPRASSPLDAAVVPGALLLIARDLLLHDPPRVLAWRLLHEPRLASPPGWLAPFVPSPSGVFDRDPVALLLAAFAVAVAAVYFVAAMTGAPARLRAALLAGAAFVLVAMPTLAFMGMGAATGRPYGQDGGVVQLPLALDHLLDGKSPYGADYSDSMLGKQARASDFWVPYGGNPILRHHAYLPGTHLIMMPFYLLGRAVFGGFDPRIVTLLAWAGAALLAVRLPLPPDARLAAAAAVLVNPLVYWHQIFGANDLIVGALLLGAVMLVRDDRPVAAGVVLGLACATKQLAWPFAPFLFAHLSGARSLRDLFARPALGRMARPILAAALVMTAVIAPVAALDPRAFRADIISYNMGLPGGDRYPLGGTPGFGFANFLIAGHVVSSLRDPFPFGVFYALLIPLGLLLLRLVVREGTLAAVLAAGSAALLASLYFTRVAHANYLVLVAVLLPLAFLMGHRAAVEVAVAPLLLLAVAVEMVEGEVFRAVWAQARSPHPLAADPFGLAVAAAVAGIALGMLCDGLLGAPWWRRGAWLGAAAVAAVIVPTVFVVWSGVHTGTARAQDEWLAHVVAPAPADEAWSASFRRDPPGPLIAGAAAPPAGPRAPVADPRPLTLAAFALAVFFLARLAPPEARWLALAGAVLSPAMVFAVVFGSPQPIVLGGLGGGALLARARGWPVRWGLLAGGVLTALAVDVAGGGPRWSAVGPSLGLSNLFLYWGAEASTAWIILTLAAIGLTGAAVLGASMSGPPLAAATAAWLVGLWFLPTASPHAVATALALMVLAAAWTEQTPPP
jgi:Glycosyltransferase family 87